MKSKVIFQRYGKYQKKMYIMNLMLSLILTSILVPVIFGLVFQMNARDYRTAMDESVEKTLGNASLKSEIIAEALHTIEKSQELQSFLSASTRGEYYLYSSRLKDRLTRVSSRYLNAAFVLSITIPEKSASVITPYGTTGKESFAEEFFGDAGALAEQSEKLTARGNGASFSFERERVLHYMKYDRLQDRPYLIFLQVPLAELIDFAPAVSWNLADHQTIFAGRKNISYEQMQAIVSDGRELIESRKEVVFARWLDGLDWILTASYEKKKPDMAFFFFYFLLPFLALAALIAAVSSLITRSLYRPIKELVTETKSIVPADNEHDEIKLLKQGAAQAHQLSKDLRETLSEKERLLHYKQNRDLLFGILPPEADRKEGQLYVVAVFSLHNLASEEKCYLFKQYLQEKLESSAGVRYINTEDISCTLILEAESLEAARRFISEKLEDSPADAEVQIALSDPGFGMESIKTLYLQCSLLLQYKYLYRQQRFLSADLIPLKADENYSYPLAAENSLIQAVLRGNPESLKLFDRIISQNEKIMASAPQTQRRFVLMLTGTLHRILREFYMEIPLKYDLHELDEEWQNPEIFARIRQDISDILNFVASKEKQEDDDLAKTLLTYIEEHYHEDIMLVDLAEKINASEKYCSMLFKQSVGENFKTYLNNFRIERAKEILRAQPDAKISEVAERVGFNSANTFIRVFSKHVGLTPKAFAEKE